MLGCATQHNIAAEKLADKGDFDGTLRVINARNEICKYVPSEKERTHDLTLLAIALDHSKNTKPSEMYTLKDNAPKVDLGGPNPTQGSTRPIIDE